MTKLKLFEMNFNGRLVGAIGATYPNNVNIQAENEDQARLKLYKDFEHISGLEIKNLGDCGYSTVDLIRDCGFERDDFKMSCEAVHEKMLLEHHDKLGYVMVTKHHNRKHSRVWCYAKGVSHGIAFNDAIAARKPDCSVIVYKVLQSQGKPILGALNVFCAAFSNEQCNLQAAMPVQCEFKVI